MCDDFMGEVAGFVGCEALQLVFLGKPGLGFVEGPPRGCGVEISAALGEVNHHFRGIGDELFLQGHIVVSHRLPLSLILGAVRFMRAETASTSRAKSASVGGSDFGADLRFMLCRPRCYQTATKSPDRAARPD
jgi:hypothetical protein